MPTTTYPVPVCAAVCDCNLSIGNVGTGCATPMGVEKRAWVMNKYTAAGALNYIDLTATLNDSYFSSLINNVDPLSRIYPLPEIKNVVDVRDKPITKTYNDDSMVFVRDGTRKYEGFYVDNASPQLVGILESQRCARPCKFSIDANGTIWGKLSSDGTKLYPIEMEAASVTALWVKPTDKDPQEVGYSFNYKSTEKDCKVRGLPMSSLEADAVPLNYEGLLDIFVKVISCSTTTLVVKLYTIWGTSPLDPLTDKGLVVGDFSLTKVASPYTATPTSVALTGTGSSFTESPQGTYTFVYKTSDDPSSTDHLALTPTKAGRDYKAVKATTIVVA